MNQLRNLAHAVSYYKPLDILATIGVIVAYLCGCAMLSGFYFTETYPYFIWPTLAACFVFIIITAKLFIRALQSNQKKIRNALSVIFSLFFLFMVFIPLKLKPDLHANPLVTQTWYHFIEISYFGLQIGISLCLQALRLKSDINIDKATIPWTVKLSGLMLFIVCIAFTSRYFILYYLNVPMYNSSAYTLLFLSIGMLFFTIQHLGKYGPFYRSENGQQLFTTFSVILCCVSILHCIGPIIRQIAVLYHYTDQQFYVALLINRVTSAIEMIACIVIFSCMRQLITSQYYFRFKII